MMASREAAVDGWCATAHTKAWLIKAAMHLLSALAIDASSDLLSALEQISADKMWSAGRIVFLT
jgi:hypothetical protein